MFKKLIIAFTLLFSFFSKGQKENNNWCMGATNARLDFNISCAPTVYTNSSSNAYEGPSAISDPLTGQLLFNTNGLQIFDATNAVMQNCPSLAPSNSITQNLIIPKPGSSSIYYLFITETQGGSICCGTGTPGINYSIIDMTGNAGLGTVVSANIHLADTGNCEKLTAIRHNNGTDIWVLAHDYGTNNFFVYSVTSAGVNATASTISIGPSINHHPGNVTTIGELKASPDGKKIAFTTFVTGTTCLFDFNNLTGQITNSISLQIGSGSGGYGVSFSPDNSKLYISSADSSNYYNVGKIWQFDISSGNPVIIQATQYLVYNNTFGSFRSLKIGPDGKVYAARTLTVGTGDYYLGVIQNPNVAGVGCNYLHNGVYLNGSKGSWGLNNIMESSPCGNVGILSNENFLPNKIFVYPNPNNGNFVLHIDKAIEKGDLTIFNCLGQTLYEYVISEQHNEIKLENIPVGIYSFTLKEKGAQNYSGKFIIDQ